jgi:type IV fimbrial biogenesis protein FimT
MRCVLPIKGEAFPRSGFTLIELMVTVAVAAVVLAIAVPSFQDLIRSNRLATQANQLITALSLARGEAIKRGVRVTVCKSANSTATSPACTTSGDWRQGWVVFVDNTQVTGNVAGTIDGTDQRLRVFEPLSGTASLTGGPDFQDWISYLPSGISRGTTGDDIDGTFKLCQGSTGSKAKNIVVNKIGWAHVENTTC